MLCLHAAGMYLSPIRARGHEDHTCTDLSSIMLAHALRARVLFGDDGGARLVPQVAAGMRALLRCNHRIILARVSRLYAWDQMFIFENTRVTRCGRKIYIARSLQVHEHQLWVLQKRLDAEPPTCG